jgi:hypothetical protein
LIQSAKPHGNDKIPAKSNQRASYSCHEYSNHGDDPEAMGTLGEVTVKKAVGRENVSGAIAGTAEAEVSSKIHVRRGKFKMVVAARVGATG